MKKKLFFAAALFLIGITAFSQKRAARTLTRNELLNQEYCSGLFSTSGGDYFDLRDDDGVAASYRNILQWLEGRVSGLKVVTEKTYNLIPYIRNEKAAVYVDEIMMDSDYLNTLSVTDIAMVKIMKGPFSGLRGSNGGVIAIYTKR